MQQFVVPQFIEVEDKIIGPITVRQFIIMLVGAGFIFIAYKLSDFILFLIQAVVYAFITFIFAFIKVNGRPIHYLFLNVIQTLRRPKVKVWNKTYTLAEIRAASKVPVTILTSQIRTKNVVRASRLAELSLVVDTGGIYQGENTLGLPLT